MKDLTQGSITRALVAMAVPIAIGMLFQTLYLLVDLYFVARLGDAAIAGVSSAGTAGFVILALTQMLGVGTVALVSHAVGRKDQAEANLVFNQSVLLSAICGVLTLVAGFVAVGVGCLWVYFVRLEHYVGLDPQQWRPHPALIRRILNVGLPAGGEFLMLFVILAVIYWVIRGFGPAAQAGFGVGGRVMQGLFLPVMALAFAVTPVAGQNFGARRYERVRETFRQATALSSALMLALTLLCQWRSEWFIEVFTRQPDAVEVGATYLRVIAWNFLATGLIFSCSGMFQALGNTWPSLASSGARLLTFVLPAVLLSTLPHFTLMQVWYLSVASVTLQALTSLALLRREFRRRLVASPEPPGAAASAAVPVTSSLEG